MPDLWRPAAAHPGERAATPGVDRRHAGGRGPGLGWQADEWARIRAGDLHPDGRRITGRPDASSRPPRRSSPSPATAGPASACGRWRWWSPAVTATGTASACRSWCRARSARSPSGDGERWPVHSQGGTPAGAASRQAGPPGAAPPGPGRAPSGPGSRAQGGRAAGAAVAWPWPAPGRAHRPAGQHLRRPAQAATARPVVACWSGLELGQDAPRCRPLGGPVRPRSRSG